jgi:hypothetical protein
MTFIHPMLAGYLFVHIPKTAGTSFRIALARILSDAAISPPFVASRLSEKDIQTLDQYRIVAGHISIDDVARFRDRQVLTILREPADRCLSWYYFAHNIERAPGQTAEVRAAQELTVDKFFRLERQTLFRNIFNRQTRQLGGHVLDPDIDLNRALGRAKRALREAGWVGLVATLPADLARLRNRFREFSIFDLPRLNVTQSRQAPDGLDPGILASIRALNAYDLDLYRFAVDEISAGRLG